MPDHHSRIGLEGTDDGDRVRDVRDHPIRLHLSGTARAAIPADIDRDGTEPRRGERRELVPPRPPPLGKAVDQQHERPVPELDRAYVPARDGQHAVASTVNCKDVHAPSMP